MEVISFAGLTVNRTTFSRLFLNRTMVVGYVLFAIALIGVYKTFQLRYFSPVVNAHDAGLNPTDPALIEAMRQAVFGSVGEIDRNAPWTLLISYYIYMLYTGSGIIFLVTLAELMKVRIISKTAAAFMILGLAMVFAGLFTIMTDLHVFNMQWMLLTPNTHADELFAKLPKDKVTIFYCASGARAMEAYLKLADANKDVAKVMYFDAMVSCNSENCSISVNEPLGL